MARLGATTHRNFSHRHLQSSEWPVRKQIGPPRSSSQPLFKRWGSSCTAAAHPATAAAEICGPVAHTRLATRLRENKSIICVNRSYSCPWFMLAAGPLFDPTHELCVCLTGKRYRLQKAMKRRAVLNTTRKQKRYRPGQVVSLLQRHSTRSPQ